MYDNWYKAHEWELWISFWLTVGVLGFCAVVWLIQTIAEARAARRKMREDGLL